MATIIKILSGGQTGADLAALDAAIEAGIEYGGWVPKGRLNENGIIPEVYENLLESVSEDPAVRTERNIRDSNVTLILSHGHPTGGSAYTLEVALKLACPVLVLDLSELSCREAVYSAKRWLGAFESTIVLNVAGPRNSEDGNIYDKTRVILACLLRALG